MKHLSGNHLHRWWVPLASGVIFFLVIALLIPYSASLYGIKKSLGGLVWALSSFGEAAPKDAPQDYTYCLFVPVIFTVLVYMRRKDLGQAAVRGTALGLFFLVPGVLLYWFGLRAENQYFGYLSVQILLAGVILWLWGWSVFRILLFPWAFCIFAWPVPFLDPIIAFPLRMVMSTMASHLLPLIGIPCVQNGTALFSPPDVLHGVPLGARFQIDIADPCSGIRSLFALLMISALLGYLCLPRLWQQWVVFLSAFPLAILGNLVRVLMLVFGSICFGSAFALGTNDNPSWYHEGCGFLIYAVALGAELGLASLLTRNRKDASDLSDAEHVSV
ncbi:MAG TPA: exosortase/archaeosortase family protein [Candidatus Methylacidiphilales bacterium]|jgi:exosortase|nr:exosortase/archaeosortase family protein [Candidatus Methylacidiphilales bacterium]